MIKECNITINNEEVTVVEFGDVKIQFPSIKKEAKSIFVEYDNGKYSIVESKKACPDVEDIIVEKSNVSEKKYVNKKAKAKTVNKQL